MADAMNGEGKKGLTFKRTNYGQGVGNSNQNESFIGYICESLGDINIFRNF